MTRPDRPNILVVAFDSLGEKACADLAAELPVLARLRAGSRVFANAFAPSPESGPARASLFTGLDMAAHGVWTDGVALPERERTFPERFADCGYRTWLVGRRHLAGVSNWTTEHARPQEYAVFDWAHGPLHRSRQNAYLGWLNDTAPETYAGIFPAQANPDETDIPPAQHAAMGNLSDELSFNSWIGRQVCAQLVGHDGDVPFLGIAGFVVGETMGGPPREGTPGEGLNRRALRQADAALGAILRCLEDAGLAEHTALVVTASRGSTSAPGAALNDEALRVPLMLRLSGAAPQTICGAVSTMDLAPTLFDLARVPPPRRIQGQSLLTGEPRGWALTRLRNPALPWQTSLRGDRWKLVMVHGDPNGDQPPAFRLHDMASAPAEARDLAGSAAHGDTLEEMIDRMIDARVALEDRTEPRIAKF